MKIVFLLFFALVLATSCLGDRQSPGKSGPTKPEVTVEEQSENHEASTPIGPSFPVPQTKAIFTVNIKDTNYTPEQKIKLQEASKILEKLFNSPDYVSEIAKSKPFTSTKLSNFEVMMKLYEGAEALAPAIDFEMDLTVTMYHANNTTVGYTYPKSMVVFTNSKFHNKYTACQVAGNLAHEWTHKMGFGHKSAKDSLSVPYSHGTIVKTLCEKFR